jgi:hypothetical protein
VEAGCVKNQQICIGKDEPRIFGNLGASHFLQDPFEFEGVPRKEMAVLASYWLCESGLREPLVAHNKS